MMPKNLRWPFAFMFLIFAAIATFSPYLVLYYQSLGLSGSQIGLLVGATPLITLFTIPLITNLADRTNRHQLILGLLLMVVMLVLVLYPQVQSYILLLPLAILSAIAFSPVLPLANSAAMFMLGQRRDLYGRVRLGGTLGFSIAAAAAGVLVENYGLKFAFWGGAVVLATAFLASQKLVHSEAAGAAVREKGRAGDLLKNPHFLLFLVIGLAGGVSFATLNTYFFPYMKELGAGESIMGLALTIGTISEIPLLFFAGSLIKRFRPFALLMLSLALTALRFLLLAAAPDPRFVLLIQLLNGFNTPLLTVAAVTYADERAPKGYHATAQGLFNAASNAIGAAIGGFAGGLLFDYLGARGMYLAFTGFLALVLVVVTVLRRALPPEAELSAIRPV